jgi:hypothetical protein
VVLEFQRGNVLNGLVDDALFALFMLLLIVVFCFLLLRVFPRLGCLDHGLGIVEMPGVQTLVPFTLGNFLLGVQNAVIIIKMWNAAQGYFVVVTFCGVSVRNY